MQLKIYLFLATFLFPLITTAQTPEQSYFDWATLPFSKEELAQRRNKFINILKKQGKNGLVLIPAKDGFSFGETFRQLDDFYYFTGLELPNAILVMNVAIGTVVAYVPDRDTRFENGSRPNDFPGRPLLKDKTISDQSGIVLKNINDFPILMNQAAAANQTIFINSGRPGPVIYSSDEYVATYSPVQILLNALQTQHEELKFENIYASIAGVRMIKSPAEIKLMRKAVDITVDGIIAAAKAVKPGVDERYLEGVSEGVYKMKGSQRLAFGSIIKSGPNSLWPWRILATHYDRRNRNMEAGELVVFDVGCEYNHYVSDVGRTFPVSGRFTERQKEILEMETGIADQIIDFIKPGVTFNDMRQLIDRIMPADAKKYMQVSLVYSHHLGLSTGDPNISNATLQSGMIFTVEPWYYNHDEQISVFTEDVILVTADGCEVLSGRLPRTPEGLEALMKE